MQKNLRIIDANINRIAEGLRVIEDIARFKYDDLLLTNKIRTLRHAVREKSKTLNFNMLIERDADSDVGLNVSQSTNIDTRQCEADVLTGNFKRVQEGLRVVEETLKLEGYYELAKHYETLRYKAYSLESETGKLNRKKVKLACLNTDIYCLTASEYSKGRSNIEVVKAMIDAGIKVIQYREKDFSLKQKYNECEKIRTLAKDANVTFIVNDHIDIAMMVEADGIHIGQDDIPINKVRQLVGDKIIIGISTHSSEQAQEAVKSGADYIGVGPIFKTATKKNVCQPVGFEYLDYVVKNISLPFVAIGGIKETNIREVIEHGAKCSALVTEIVGADNIELKIKALRDIITNTIKNKER